MGKGVSEQLIKQVVVSTVAVCGQCSHQYDESSVSVVGHQEGLWFLSLVCGHCQARSLVAALVDDSIQPVTDLLPSELERFHDVPTVGADDVLDVHQFLDGFDGDFKALFDH